MKLTSQTVLKLIAQLKELTQRVTQKDPTLTVRETDSSFYKIMHDLWMAVPVYLHETTALDAILEAASELESYRGKGSQTINDEYPRILKSIIREISYFISDPDDSPNKYPIESTQLALKKIAPFSLQRAIGDGKRIRSKRAAQIRFAYWEILTDICDITPFTEALDLAKKVAPDTKASLPEREGAIDYLLTHLYIGNDQDNEDTPETTEIKSILNTIRENPPSRDILFQILDAEVKSGEIDEMTALFDLKDWDKKNEDKYE